MGEWPVGGVDIGVGAVIGISALIAFGRGFVRELLAVAGWVGAIFATIYGLPYLKPYVREIISIGLIADFVAGVVIFVVSLMLFSLLTGFIAKRVQASALNILDRSLGLLFGVLRGAVLVCLAYVVVEWMMPPKEQPAWLRSARTMPLVEVGAALLKSLVPDDAAAAGAGIADDARKKARKALETQRVLRDILIPEPKGAGTDGPTGYDRRERSDMERLIESNR